MKPSPRGGWHCPGPASRLWHCPDSSFAPLGLTPYAGQILPSCLLFKNIHDILIYCVHLPWWMVEVRGQLPGPCSFLWPHGQ